MALGDGIRRNIATVIQQERDRFHDAIIALHQTKIFSGSHADFPASGVSFWFKQDEIHQAPHVHGGRAFLPWHRVMFAGFRAKTALYLRVSQASMISRKPAKD